MRFPVVLLVLLVVTSGASAEVRIDGSYRLRFAVAHEIPRPGFDERDTQVLAHRLLVRAATDRDGVGLVAELGDSRTVFDDDGTPLGTDDVNALEPVQAHLRYRVRGGDDATWDLRLGRMTMDVGSRRLVARNRFRNTLNTFTGARAIWSQRAARAEAFFVRSVARRPTDRDALDANEIALDGLDAGAWFWGLFGARPIGPVRAETYAFGLDEAPEDGGRSHVTLGFRARFERSVWEARVEAALQAGSVERVERLEHRAHFVHVRLSRAFDDGVRVDALFDLASGDDDPDDDRSGRFDTLFGARRFEYGPTGIHGLFARGNVVTPGLRLVVKQGRALEIMATHRGFWLESARDAWVGTGWRDPEGGAGTFVGQQFETRVRWRPEVDGLLVEGGFAVLFAGEFADAVVDPSLDGSPITAYAQLRYRFDHRTGATR
mgnify:CR=1 FL=1